MRYGFRLFLLGALGVAACAFTARGDDGTEVKFDTLDGVTLKGTFFTADPVAPAKDKKATVLLLHNIDKDKGGSSHQDGWDDLAKSLSAQGYSVLSFDFRGFGKSHEVSDTFWDPIKGKHNMENVAGASRKPDTIDHKDFDAKAGEYYPYLVNDIVAAKSYLDRQTDKGTANSSSLFLVGAGEGATLGAMWMATQWHLKKFAGYDQKTGQPTLGDPEGRDIAGAVWLSISPKLGGRTVTQTLSNMTTEVGADDKVPMAFLYGSKDETSDSLAKRALQDIERRVKHDNPGMTADGIKGKMELTNTKAVEDSKLVGSQLLGVSDTPGWVIKYVNQVSEKRGLTEPRNHDVKEYSYYWTLPGVPPRVVLAKSKEDENINLPPMDKFIHFGGN